MRGVNQIKNPSSQSRVLTILIIVMLASAGMTKVVFWKLNRITPVFRVTSQSTYQSIRDCDERLTEEITSFQICVDNAARVLGQLKLVATSHRERVQYALLASYLRKVRDCRADWEQSDASTDAKGRLDQLRASRQDLEQRVRKD